MFYKKIDDDFSLILNKIENNKIRSYLKQGIKKNWFIFYNNNMNHETINNISFIQSFLKNQEMILPVFEKKIKEMNLKNYDEEISAKDFFYLSLFLSILLLFSGQFYKNLYFNGEFENNEKILFVDNFLNIKKHILGISTINFLRTGRIFDPLMENRNNEWLIKFWELFSSQEKYKTYKMNILDYLFRDFFFCCESKSVSIFKENSLSNKTIEYDYKKIINLVHKIINFNLFLCRYDELNNESIISLQKSFRYNLMTYIYKYLKNYENSIFYGSLNEAYKSLQFFDKYDLYEKIYLFNDLKKLSDKLLNYNLSHIKDMYESKNHRILYDQKVELLDSIGYYASKMFETHQKSILTSYSITSVEFKENILYVSTHFTFSRKNEQIYEKMIEDSIIKLKNFGIILNQS
ncbi:MAG: hypothetical protein ACQESN_05435 [Thermotogota bacterium]